MKRRMKGISFLLPQDQARALRVKAAEQDRSTASLLRELVAEFLRKAKS